MTSGEANVADLVRTLQSDRLDEAVARDLTRALARDGLRCSPSLFTILAERGEPRSAPAEYDSPGFAADVERLDDAVVTVRHSESLALTGVAMVTLVIACVGWYRWHPYAGVVLVAGVVAAAAVGPWYGALEHRLPGGAPRGRLLGAAIAVACTLVCLVAFAAARRVLGA